METCAIGGGTLWGPNEFVNLFLLKSEVEISFIDQSHNPNHRVITHVQRPTNAMCWIV